MKKNNKLIWVVGAVLLLVFLSNQGAEKACCGQKEGWLGEQTNKYLLCGVVALICGAIGYSKWGWTGAIIGLIIGFYIALILFNLIIVAVGLYPLRDTSKMANKTLPIYVDDMFMEN